MAQVTFTKTSYNPQYYIVGRSFGTFPKEEEKAWNNQPWMVEESKLKVDLLRARQTLSKMKGESRERWYSKEEYAGKMKAIRSQQKRVNKLEERLEKMTIKL